MRSDQVVGVVGQGGTENPGVGGSIPSLPTILLTYGSRLLEPLGCVPPAEFEQAYHDRQTAPVGLAVLT
jgi:hypothetical protein